LYKTEQIVKRKLAELLAPQIYFMILMLYKFLCNVGLCVCVVNILQQRHK